MRRPLGALLSVAALLATLACGNSNDNPGFTVLQFQRGFQIPAMCSGVLLLGLIGVVPALLFRLVERRALGWYPGQRAGRREW